MSGMLSSPKLSETAVRRSGSSMHFWGVCCESGKQYAQVVGQRFRITMAVLDPKSFHNDASEKIVSLIVLRGGIEYLLCVLKHGEIHQVNLNLIFDKGENVKFYINGHGKVYLSGYQLTNSECDMMNDENGYLCPLVEVKSKSKKSSSDKVGVSPIESEAASSSKKNKVSKPIVSLWSSYISELDIDDESDESDEDFTFDDEETDDEEVSDEIEDGELEDLNRGLLNTLEEGSNEEEIMQNSFVESRKRRRQEKSPSKKRSRSDSQNASTSVENADDVICIEDNDDNESDDEDTASNVNSASCSTPMPTQRNSETAFSEKKSKKEKKIKEILKSIGELNKKEASSTQTTTVAKSPKQSKHPLVTLKGGVEIQDVIVGKGPLVTNGKLLHIFFVGRLSNNTIFDARVPGKKPFTFKLGSNQVIRGLEVAVQGMRVGGRRKIKVPPSMAYGASGKDIIPPNETLRFVVDLQSIS